MRTPSSWRASLRDGIRFWHGIALITARLRAHYLLAIRGDGPRNPAFRAWFTCSIRITASREDGNRAESSLAMIEETIQLEGPQTIAAFILEPVTGTNGVLIPPDGYMEGVRKLCDKYGIVMIADEVMSGFGRTGEWFAVNHWRIVPDLLCMAKGSRPVICRSARWVCGITLRSTFRTRFSTAGSLTTRHPMGCAAALATIRVYEEDRLIENAKKMGAIMKGILADLQSRHPSVGAVRSIGLFGIIELIRSHKTKQPMAAFNGTSEAMAALALFSANKASTPSFAGTRSLLIRRYASMSSRCGGICHYRPRASRLRIMP